MNPGFRELTVENQWTQGQAIPGTQQKKFPNPRVLFRLWMVGVIGWFVGCGRLCEWFCVVGPDMSETDWPEQPTSLASLSFLAIPRAFGLTVVCQMIYYIPSIKACLLAELVVQLQGRCLFWAKRVPVFLTLWNLLRKHNSCRTRELSRILQGERASAYCTGSGGSSKGAAYRATQVFDTFPDRLT